MPGQRTRKRLPRAWPPYVPAPVERTIAVMIADGRLLTEYGEYLAPMTWQELSDCMFQNNLQVFIGAVGSAMQDWIPELRADMAQEGRKERGQWAELQYSSNRLELSAVRIHRKWLDRSGRRMCWQVRNLTVSNCWARAIDPELTTDLRYVYTKLGTGVCATPGATGMAALKQFWRGKSGKEMPRHYRPSLRLVDALDKHAIGSRREAYKPTEIFDEAYELDAYSGYCSQAGELPCGKALYFKNGDTELWREPRPDVWCWWGHAWVRIYDQGLAPGDVAPFATRDEDGRLHWPTAAGLYHVWIWSWEAEELRKRELEGEPIACLGVEEAWAWTQHTEQLQEWQQFIDRVRREAVAYSKACGDLIKMVIVATVGAMGIPYEYLSVSAEPTETSVPLHVRGMQDMELHLTQEFDDKGTPKHWQSFILGSMNFRIYQQLRRCYLEDIPVAACNVDCVITLRRPYWGSDPEFVKLGDFKLKKMGTWVACPGPGVTLDPDNQRYDVPGMSMEEKIAAMGLWRVGERYIPQRDEKSKRSQQRGVSQSLRVRRAMAAHESANRLRLRVLKEA